MPSITKATLGSLLESKVRYSLGHGKADSADKIADIVAESFQQRSRKGRNPERTQHL